MKKGISTIIAAIILVVITIGLIATAYLYFSGIVTVGPVITIASAYCVDSSVHNISISIRNDGTATLNEADITWLVDGVTKDPDICDFTSIDPIEMGTCYVTGTGGRHDVKAIGPRNQAGGPIDC